MWAYLLPAAALILLTLIALARLFVLKSRATVMIEPEWLTVLARAQRRMGFKRFDRVVYEGRRDEAPVDFIQKNNQLIGPIFELSVRGNF